MELKIFSFFSGLGLLDLGFEENDYTILEVFEFYKPFLEAYKYAREDMNFKEPKYGYSQKDISELNKDKNFENKVLLEKEEGTLGFIGGPPCPDFSIAGKNRGSEGINGRLTTDYFELIKRNHPHFFLFENVKGIWSTKRHKEYIRKKISEMENEGYLISYGILNSIDYGAPQNRERFFIIGVDSEKSTELGIYNHFNMLEESLFTTDLDVAQYNWPELNIFAQESNLEPNTNILEEITVESWFRKNDVYDHYNSLDFFQPKSLEKFNTIDEGDVSRKSFKRLHRWRYAPTAAYGNNEVHLHPYLPRRISVAEALAIQSAPKEFKVKKELSMTDKFKCVGNAVPFLLSSHIAKTIREYLEGRF
ncbi:MULTISPECIES: DNA cytosine methyltransferase [unclassified Enterococcus]|uniref:DNA cytosine methyltransferase n=1 Tax=unclassified Enterococcus TaxID=2608891 RepID=UPI001CE0D28E|nr:MULTISPECIES: DNA cytosine methyltransferase [unclassified Enterococcus]MCA5011776.1 DNA cytosine methyltransferase [Enterococcus sp. S23]MCA5014782.1 DNA cytosine methyltransferase [Enterococcus sp. S22(2020)]